MKGIKREPNIKTVQILDLKPHPKNPKNHDKKRINKSLKQRGFVGAITIDENNVILAGHGRIEELKKLGKTTVQADIVEGWTDKEKEQYMLDENKMSEVGGYDFELLKEHFDIEGMEEAGFTNTEIKIVFDDKEEKTTGEEQFTTEILEENNYIVFTFNNVLDFQVIESLFELKTVHAIDSKEGYERKGIGRVINGIKLLKILNENNNP